MKLFSKICCAILALLLAAVILSCGTDSDGEKAAQCDTSAIEKSTVISEEEADGEETTKMQTTDLFGNGYNTNMLVGFDEQGHTISPISSEREGKQVGIFYWIWLGQPYASDIYDVSEIIEKYGKDEVFKNGESTVSPNGQAHWWAQPQFGYYNSADEWVIRKHLEMLTDAGIDFIVFDTTNALTYDNVAKKIMKVITELRQTGWDAPQVVYFTHSYSIQTIRTVYNNIYKANEYPEAWYRVDGKPMIIGYTDGNTDTLVSGNNEYKPGDLEQELLDFFYIREARWPYDPVGDNTWPYVEWSYPQPLNGDMLSVAIASHPMVPFSFSLTRRNWCNWGRGYDVETGKNVHADIEKGTFFDSQWKTAYEKDPDFVFVTGWNQWIAYKQLYDGEYMLCDCVDMEYSFDAEPMSGGYEDAYFIQMIDRIRKYKYVSAEGLTADTVKKTIDINGDSAQWDSVNVVYRRVGNDNIVRNSYGGAKTVAYRADAVENNILEVKVTCDESNIYFMIKTENDIKPSDAQNYMNIYIGRGTPSADKGWESYEFAINRKRIGNSAEVEKLNSDYTGETVGKAELSVNGNIMQVSVPRTALGFENGGDFYFKVADGVENPQEIMNYYSSGRSLPMGRLSYIYQIN